MKSSKALVVLSGLIAVLAIVAALAGIFYPGDGQQFAMTSVRGETVTIYGHGLYRFDPLFSAAQAVAQDVVTLVVGVPMLLIALCSYRRRQLRGQLLLAGTLAYFLYTYTSLAFGIAFNPLFLVYVALFSLSLYAFVIAMLGVDLRDLPTHFAEKLPRRWIAGFMFGGGAFLALAWLGRIVPPTLAGIPPEGLGTNTTLFIQVLDLGLIVPTMALAGVTLLRRQPLGYLLASVALIKFMTMGLALVAMIIGQALAGVAMAPAEVVIFPIMAIVGIAMAFMLLGSVREAPAASGAAPQASARNAGAAQAAAGD